MTTYVRGALGRLNAFDWSRMHVSAPRTLTTLG